MTKQIITLDEKDRKIITLLHDNQEISQENIAKQIHLSQPAVAMRIKKLKENGVVDQIIGVNLNKVGIYVAIVFVRTTNTTKILNMFRNCPFFLNGFVISGEKNLMLLLAGEDLSSLESMIDERLRSDEDVQSADFNIMISSIKEFIMPIKMVEKPLKIPPCGVEYKECQAYYENRCFGCPSTKRYKGSFW
ncbi:MAG: Lrp/AsnC family transcriptional regulator [Candidatus Thermoplasmatota archaeon]|nr:Lrp/AsnC family transcriptional regulator [Candidatus Thermoplasmatota archaeon]